MVAEAYDHSPFGTPIYQTPPKDNFYRESHTDSKFSLWGVFFLVLASFLWGFGNVLVSSVTRHVDPTVTMILIYGVEILMTAPFYNFKIPRNRKAFLIQLAIMTFYYMTSSMAYAFSDPNDIMAILTTTIFATPIISKIVLYTDFNKLQLCLILSWCFVGIILLIQPPVLFSSRVMTYGNMFGYLLATCGMLGRSLLIVYQSRENVDAMSMTFWSPVAITSIFSVQAFTSNSDPTMSWTSAIVIMLIGFLWLLGTFLSFKGWGMVSPIISSMLYQTQVIFTFGFSIIFGVASNVGILKFMGVVMVLSGVITYQYLDALQQKNNNYKYEDDDL